MRNEDGNNNIKSVCNRKPYGTWRLIAHYSNALVTINASSFDADGKYEPEKKTEIIIMILVSVLYHVSDLLLFDDVETPLCCFFSTPHRWNT